MHFDAVQHFDAIQLGWIAILGLAAGLLIGCVGIGGVILVPALIFFGGVPIRIGIPAAMFAYILSGLVATAVFARNKSINWNKAILLCIAAAPPAFAGAWAVSVVNPQLLELFLGLLTFLSGVNALKGQSESHAAGRGDVSSKTLVGVGAGVGFFSSVSGTGGPLILVPILVSMSMPVITAIGLSQAIQVPIAIAATAGNILYGTLDLTLSGVLAVSITVGSWYGAKLAHAVSRLVLRRIVATLLVVVGLFILGNVLRHFLIA